MSAYTHGRCTRMEPTSFFFLGGGGLRSFARMKNSLSGGREALFVTVCNKKNIYVFVFMCLCLLG